MENEQLNKLFETQYPFEVFLVTDEEDDNDSYFFAFHPDFGHATCSAVGDTAEEALSELEAVRKDVIQYYYETGKRLPTPSKAPFETGALQQMPIRIPKHLHLRLLRLASQSGQSLNAYVQMALTEHVALEVAAEKIADRIESVASAHWYSHVDVLMNVLDTSTEKYSMSVPPELVDIPRLRVIEDEPPQQKWCSGWEE